MTKNLAKLLIIFASCVLIALFLTGIVQSFILEQKRNAMENYQAEITELEAENQAISTDDYRDAYGRQEEGKGGENDIIYN